MIRGNDAVANKNRAVIRVLENDSQVAMMEGAPEAHCYEPAQEIEFFGLIRKNMTQTGERVNDRRYAGK